MDRVEVEAKILVPAAVTVACLAPAAAGCQFGWGWPVLVMASLLLAFCLCMRKALAGEELQGRAVIAVLLGILAIHVVQTIPVGGRLAQIASPIAWNFWETSGPGGSRPLTASVKETRDAILKFSACIAAFLIGVGLFSARKNARVLAACVFGTASVLGAYGLYVLLFRPATKLFGVPVYDWDRLSGVYTNANRFCGLLEMALPLGIALLLEGRSAAGRSSPDAGDGYPAHAAGRNGIASTKGIPQGGGRDAGWRDAILAFAVAFAALTLLLTRSRLGIISFLSGGSVAMWAAGGARASLRRAWPWLAFASVAAMAFTLAYGVEDATGRLAATGGDDLERRRSCWAATLTMILDHPILGCGAGAFESLFPYYQPPGLRGYWNYAHSDWLSVPAELGLAGSALAATGIVLWLRAALPAAGKGGGWLPVGMLWGILAVLMHSLGDSPAMEPANAFLLFLLGGAVSGMAGRAASETVASGAGHPAVGGGRGGGGRTAPVGGMASDAAAGGGGEGRGTPVSRLQRAAEALRRWAPAALTGGVLAASAPICAGLIAAQAISDGATVALEISAAGYTGDPAHGGDAVGGGGGAGANGWADREGSHGNDRGSQGRDDTSKESGLPDWKIEAAAEILRFDPCSSAAMKTLAVGLLEKADEAVAACRQGNAARMRDEADRLLRRALWLEPLDHAAWYVMGAAAFREGRMPEAIALMERSARAAPAWPGPAGTLAGMRLAAWVQEGRRDGRLLAEAMENLRAEVEADPDDGVRRALATCVRYGVPPSVWRKAVPAGPDALRTLASALISAGAAAEADAVVTEALGIAPPELAPEFLLLRAEAAFLRGEGDAGARGLAEFVAVVPSGRRGSVAARADAVLKKRAEAAGRLKWWEEVVRRHRTESWAHRGLGAVLLELGRPSDAIGPLRIAAELSGDFDSLMALARAYAAAGSYGSASAVLDDAARLMPDDIGMLDLKTRVLEAQGYYPAAADVAERLAVLDAANAPGRRKDALRLRELSRRQKEGSRIAR